MKHIHHIVPKHMGGTDDPTNLIELTIEEHAEAHRRLYEEHGKEEDKIAWMGLSGQIGKEEITKKVLQENGRKRGLANKGKTAWNKGKKMSEEFKETLRTSSKVKPPSRKGKIPWNKGKPRSEETKRKISETRKRNAINKKNEE